jgi:hypothetical protein
MIDGELYIIGIKLRLDIHFIHGIKLRLDIHFIHGIKLKYFF